MFKTIQTGVSFKVQFLSLSLTTSYSQADLNPDCWKVYTVWFLWSLTHFLSNTAESSGSCPFEKYNCVHWTFTFSGRLLYWLYSRQQNYSSTWDKIFYFPLVWSPIFVIIMLVINSIKTKVHDLDKYLFQKTAFGMSFWHELPLVLE